MCSTRTNRSFLRTCCGISSRSFSFSLGRITVLIPARCAAKTFSFTPPIGSTLPRSVISPVIATSLCTGRPVTADASAVASVMPADGPSLGTAPAGMWMCTSYFWYHSSSMPRRRARDLI